MTKFDALRRDFATAIARLEQALALPKDDIVRDSAIQRFEICFELCWKVLKAFLQQEHNVQCTSPRSCFRAAFKNDVLADDPFWIDLTVLRNYTLHTYSEPLADYVYARLPEAAQRFRQVLSAIGE